jgi:hypothetical protein
LRRFLALIAAWSLVLSGQAWALGNSARAVLSNNALYQTFYVDSAGGLDCNSGQTPGQAWQSLPHALVQKFAAQTVILLKGSFSCGGLAFTTLNAPNGYISVGNGAQATINSGNSAECYK